MDKLCLLSLLLAVMVTATIAAESKKHLHLLIKKFPGGKSPGIQRGTRHHISGFKKALIGRKPPYYLPKRYNYPASSRSSYAPYPHASHYAAYAPSLPPAPPSFYQSAYPVPPSNPSQYSDASVSSYQPPYPSSSAYPAASPSSSSSYPSPPSYYPVSSYPSQAAYPSYASSMPPSSFSSQTQELSYSSSSSSPYTYDQSQQMSYPTQLTSNELTSLGKSPAYLMPAKSSQPSSDAGKKPKPKPSPPDRTEKFEIRGRFFKSIGCWADSPKNRAMETLEGKNSQLKHHDYKTRVNALMKCAEAADELDLKLFALQNGGQCFGGKNDENTYRKHGASTECEGDGEGGPWSNEVYSFLDEDGQLLVKPPKTIAMDTNNGSSNGSKPGCPNHCANNPSSQATTPVCPDTCGNSQPSQAAGNTSCGTPQPNNTSGGGQSCGGGCQIPVLGCNGNSSGVNGTAKGNQSQPSGGCNQGATGGGPCSTQGTPSGGCGSMGAGAICPPPTSGGCAKNGTGVSGGGSFPCPPQTMPAGIPDCGGGFTGGGAPCVTIDTGCMQIGSQPVGGAPCAPPDQGMALGGCPSMGTEAMPGTSCVIQGKLVEGCPNVTTGGTPCPSTGNSTGGCVNPAGSCGNGTTNTTTGPNPNPSSNGTTTGPSPPPKCKAKADVAFIIDGSGSIEMSGKGNYKKVLNFVKELTRAFDVSKDGTHIGLVSYDSEAKVISGFDQHHTKSEIISAIEGIGYPGGGTETGKALLKAKSNLFDKSARAGIPNIAVVITDGKSSDNIGAPAQQLRDSGCTVFSLGVGKNYDMEQLKEIATDPDSQHVLKADFDSLDSSLVDTIVGTACKAAGGSIQQPPPLSLLPETKPPETKCTAKVDLAVLLDGSGRIDYQKAGNFKKCQEFLKSFVRSFNIAKDGTHAGIVQFSKTSEVMFDFEKHLDEKSITEAIDKIPYPRKGTNTGAGLDLVRTDLFDASARQGVRDILLVMTGGSSQDDVQGPAKKLRDMGVTIFSLGLGNEFQRDQLGQMATDPDSKHVITGGYEELDQLLPKVKKLTCEAAGGSISTINPKGGGITIGAGGTSGSKGSSGAMGIGIGGGIGIKGSGSAGGSAVITGGSSGSGSSSKILIKGGGGSSSSSGGSSSTIKGGGGGSSSSGGSASVTIKGGGGSSSSSGGSSSTIKGGGGGSSSSGGSASVTIKGGGGSSSSSGGSSSTIKGGVGGSSSSGGSASVTSKGGGGSSSSSSKIIRIKGGSGGSSSGSRIVSSGKKVTSTGTKIIFGGKSMKSKKQGDGESITVVRDTEKLAKENLVSGGLLGSGVCRDKVDLAFLVDASGNKDSKGQQNFKTSLEFVKAISSMFIINQLESHIGFVVFSTNSQVVLNFKTYFDQKNVEKAIDDIKYTGGLTNIGAGLELVKNKLFDSKSRPNVPRILIVVTSGKSTGEVLVPSKALRDAGVTVFCVGVGSNYDLKELDEIATDPDADHVFTADVTQMGLVVKAIKGKVCKANVRPVALFPLNARYKARDVIGGNPPGETNNVIPAVGPDDKEGGALSFYGTPESYIEFPNDGKLDTKDSLSILAWILPEKEGPIFNFKKDGWGVNLWLAHPKKLFAHFVNRDLHQTSEPLQSTKIVQNGWNYVGMTYDRTTGRAGLWINGKFEDTRNLGRFELATNYAIRMGAREGDKRNYQGRISCLQVYNVPLTSEQIANAKDICKPYERD